MRSIRFMLLGACALATSMCARPSSESPSTQTATASPAQSSSVPAKPGPLNFPTYTADKEKEIKSMKPGEWVPVKIDRHYLILHGGGIRLEGGDYFVQPLKDAGGKVTKLLLAKNRGARLNQVDLAKARAKDGSFAAVLDVMYEVEGTASWTETRAFVSSSGESGAVWVHISGGQMEWRSELMGLAGPSDKLQRHE